ncbi:hypothetical protein OAH83_00015 [Methylophilaceae bacterium]|nr:hypothetical protein [Methylophilaceae bacterium]MDC0128519.1 hypothetical protein [Methylophilaceae bacterium]
MTNQNIKKLVVLSCFFPSLLLAEVSTDKQNVQTENEKVSVKASTEEGKPSNKVSNYEGNKARNASRFKFRPGR